MYFRKSDDYGGDTYQDIETRRMIFWMGFKKFMVRFLVIGALIAAFAFYSIHNPVPDAVRHVADVDRKEAAREAIELYSQAHPEYTEEEIEIIFKNVLH